MKASKLFINERVLKEPVFDYGSLAKKVWTDLIQNAKKQFNVWFDLENNDPSSKGGKYRDIVIPQTRWDFTKCKFRCQMWSAGGDWENPLFYFKCQLIDGYAKGVGKYNNSMFIFIPNKNQGNYHLIDINDGKNKGGWRAPHDGEDKIDKERNERTCWKSLNSYLTQLVYDEINDQKNKV